MSASRRSQGRNADKISLYQASSTHVNFWVTTKQARLDSIQQLGAQFLIVNLQWDRRPPTSNCPYPPFPLEVDDEYIHASHIEPQPAGKLSKLVGFKINVRIYQTVTWGKPNVRVRSCTDTTLTGSARRVSWKGSHSEPA
ncbi:hypothetical protein LZ554_007420 [Drepanopeziza brunnea f. sp. 'monogermtubi']|nr:hypothetical protein LZ554_007420 [Drepanopeziza brunnea f. sp. 'monogermtubi']